MERPLFPLRSGPGHRGDYLSKPPTPGTRLWVTAADDHHKKYSISKITLVTILSSHTPSHQASTSIVFLRCSVVLGQHAVECIMYRYSSIILMLAMTYTASAVAVMIFAALS